jgi:hypothetical protein
LSLYPLPIIIDEIGPIYLKRAYRSNEAFPNAVRYFLSIDKNCGKEQDG